MIGISVGALIIAHLGEIHNGDPTRIRLLDGCHLGHFLDSKGRRTDAIYS
jgi:hypothetical protein